MPSIRNACECLRTRKKAVYNSVDMKKEKGPWNNPELPDRETRAKQRELLGISFDRENIDMAIAINRSRAEICIMFRTDEHELDDWAKKNFGGMTWDEYYQSTRYTCIRIANEAVQKLAKQGHVKALELTMKNLLGDESEDSSRRITIDMNIGSGEDEK